VQRGEDDLHGRAVLDRMVIHRDAAAIVDGSDPAVGQQGNLNAVGEPGQGLVDSVVDNLLDEMVESALAG
jgi:hypothetical protein